MDCVTYENLKEKKSHGDFNIFMNIYNGILKSSKDNYLHWHDEMEIVYIHSGSGNIHIDLHEYSVCSGDLIFINKGSIHYMDNPSEESILYDAIVFDLNMFLSSTIDSCSSNFIQSLINDKIQKPIINSENSNIYNELLDYYFKIKDEFSLKNFSYQLKIKGYFFLLFSLLFQDEILSSNNKIDNLEDNKLKKIRDVINYINLNYNKTIKVKDLAKISGYSEYYFLRFFKKETGKTCTNFINSIRIRKAIYLLKETELSITDIAFEVGFSDVSYFIKIFKSFTSKSPRFYRKTV